jgi:hypothetical protein
MGWIMINVLGSIKAPLHTAACLAFRIIHRHELFHFAVEYMAGQWETIIGKPCYCIAKDRLRGTNKYIFAEEECANAYMLKNIRRTPNLMNVKGKTELIKKFIEKQPPGYRKGIETSTPNIFLKRCSELGLSYVQCIPDYDPSRLTGTDLISLYPLWPRIDWRYVPIHIIDNNELYLGLTQKHLGLFLKIDSPISENEQFIHSLIRLPKNIQAAWQRIRERLSQSTAGAGMDFKLWERTPIGAVYSIRLSAGHRAHLEYDRANKSWSAIGVGTHQKMGHG